MNHVANVYYPQIVPRNPLVPFEFAAPSGGGKIIIRPSLRRRKTISARRINGNFEVLVPSALSISKAKQYALELWQREQQRSQGPSDEELLTRARKLQAKYLPEAPQLARINFSAKQKQRWGSCNNLQSTIRLNSELKNMPQYVIDAVIIHEIAHLIEPNHSKAFKELEQRYPKLAAANQFLAGYEHAKRHLDLN